MIAVVSVLYYLYDSSVLLMKTVFPLIWNNLHSSSSFIFYSYYCKGFCGFCLTELFWLELSVG